MTAQEKDGTILVNSLNQKKTLRNRVAMMLTAAVLSVGSAGVQAADFFQWGNPAGMPSPYIQAPQLTNNTLPQVLAYLSSQPVGATLAVQVPSGTTLSQATVDAVFNNYNIKYVFADYEGTGIYAAGLNGNGTTNNTITAADGAVSLLRKQISNSTKTGPSFTAGTSYIGNFNLGPITTDTTAPTGSTYHSGNTATNQFGTSTDFRNTGLNMATEALYPGDASFRNPVSGNSTAPNIRSALFTMPIQRLTLATNNLAAGQANIPYISRFNNYSNSTLSNSTYINPATGLPQNQFDTTKAITATFNGVTSTSVANAQHQLLSQDDFRALTLHYRMRGATGFQLLDSGVVGYSQADYQYDAQAGWNGLGNANGVGATPTQSATASDLAAVFGGFNARVATLPTVVTFNGTRQTIEQAGVVWSAITNDSASVPGLAILVSNMSNTNGTVNFNTNINGATLSYTTSSLTAGSHTLLRFTKSGGIWSAVGTPEPIFDDASLASRDGLGIPEPASLSLLGIGAFGILGRRRRKA